jgi:hypothetical protein
MRHLTLALLFTIMACNSTPSEPSHQAGSVLTLRYGRSAIVAGTRVTFADVVADSRCPKDVVCVWAGDAAVRLESGAESIVLHTAAAAGSTSGRLGGVTLTLEDVKPDPVSTVETKKTDYVISLRSGE